MAIITPPPAIPALYNPDKPRYDSTGAIELKWTPSGLESPRISEGERLLPAKCLSTLLLEELLRIYVERGIPIPSYGMEGVVADFWEWKRTQGGSNV